MNYRQMITHWGAAMIIFLIIGLTCLSLIFAPIKVHTIVGGVEHISTPSAISATGMILRVETWKETPEYIGGLSFITFVAFLGSFHACRAMCFLNDLENETPESKIKAGK